MPNLEWTSGIDGYRRYKLEFDLKKKVNIFTLELEDRPRLKNDALAQLASHVPDNVTAEVLYSGGLDSEAVIFSLLAAKKKFHVITGCWLSKGETINEQDIYYSEKFCRTFDIPQLRIDLDVGKFFSNGDHLPYLDPYKITTFTSACIFKLIENCETFPIVGGDYTWPQVSNHVYSPHRHVHNCYDHFMQSKGIPGIGNMLSHSQESNIMFITSHIQDREYNKHDIFQRLGFSLEQRTRSHGWEQMFKMDWKSVSTFLMTRYGPTKNIIKWGDNLAQVIETTDKINDKFR